MNYLAVWCFAYLLNALWQVPLIYVAGRLLVRLGSRGGPAFVHRIWVASLLLQVLLPAAPQPAVLRQNLLRSLWSRITGGVPPSPASVAISFGDSVAAGVFHSAGPWRWLLLTLAGTASFYFGIRLLWHLWHLRALRRCAATRSIPDDLARRFDLSRRQANVPRATLALSDRVHGPVTLGVVHPLVLLPPSFASCTSAEDQEAALAHECLHVQRGDFAKNLAYEFISLPLALHPLRHRTLAQIAASREIVCDAEAAAALAGPERYARSLLRLAAAVQSAAPTANLHAIGLCDAHTLERRIMILTIGPRKLGMVRRLGITAATLAMAGVTCTTALALRMHIAVPASQTSPEGNAVKISGEIMAGNVLTRVDPTYPPEAREAQITGTVILAAVIGRDGAIEHLSVVSGPEELQRSAVDAVRQWVYKPYILNGVPTEVQTTIHINYSLAN